MNLLAGIALLIRVINSIENIASLEKYREAFGWCFSRAMANIFISCEIGSSFVKQNGYLYVYSNETGESRPGEIMGHARSTGLAVMTEREMSEIRFSGTGILFRKTMPTPARYPRAYAAIKRDADRVRSAAAVQAVSDD